MCFNLPHPSAIIGCRSSRVHRTLAPCWWRCPPSSPGMSASRNPWLFNREGRVGDTISAHPPEDSEFCASYGGDFSELPVDGGRGRTSWKRLGTPSGSWQGRSHIPPSGLPSFAGRILFLQHHLTLTRIANTCHPRRTGRARGGFHLPLRGPCPFACEGSTRVVVFRSYLHLTTHAVLLLTLVVGKEIVA